MRKNKICTTVALAVPLVLSLTGCSMFSAFDNRYEASASKSAKTSEEGIASGLLPEWVPSGGTNIELEQRSTGHERIFVMDYTGELPEDQCTALGTVGKPTSAELAQTYAGDPRTENMDPDELVTYRTLDAEWWPGATEQNTTHLCGRWWVNLDQDKLYAFAPDVSSVAEAILKERAAAAN